MEHEFLKISSLGFVAYCDALIARRENMAGNDNYAAFLISMIGTPANIKTVFAQLYQGESVRLAEFTETTEFEGTPCRFYGEIAGNNIQTIRTRKVGDTINKIVVQRFVSGGTLDKAAVVFGPDMPTVKERAFLRLDSTTTIPLKKQWMCWLWDEVMQPEQLFSYGGEDLRYSYIVSLPTDEELQERVLNAVSLRYLQ